MITDSGFGVYNAYQRTKGSSSLFMPRDNILHDFAAGINGLNTRIAWPEDRGFVNLASLALHAAFRWKT